MVRTVASKTTSCGFESLPACMSTEREKAMQELGRLGAEFIMERLNAPPRLCTEVGLHAVKVGETKCCRCGVEVKSVASEAR